MRSAQAKLLEAPGLGGADGHSRLNIPIRENTFRQIDTAIFFRGPQFVG
jgi:hypothetical protein